MHTTSWFIIPVFSAVGFILITLKHGLCRIIERTGGIILTAFIFHLTQAGGIFEGCLYSVRVCLHACMQKYHDIECPETLGASQRHTIDMIEMKCNLSSTVTLWAFQCWNNIAAPFVFVVLHGPRLHTCGYHNEILRYSRWGKKWWKHEAIYGLILFT